MNNTDYSQWTLQELLTEAKKIKTNQLISGVVIGFLIGVMGYGLVKKGFGFLYLAIPIGLIVLIGRNAQVQKQNLKQIQAEIDAKKAP